MIDGVGFIGLGKMGGPIAMRLLNKLGQFTVFDTLEVINSGTGRNSATVDKFPRAVLPRTFNFGFATGLMYKDIRLFVEEAENLGIPLWVAPVVRQLWFQACSELGADSDFGAVVKSTERLAKVEVRG